MNIKKPVYVGIDFGNEYSQVSYYSDKEKEPVSLGLSGPETDTIYLRLSVKQWEKANGLQGMKRKTVQCLWIRLL